ncbi:MAG: hypothetical protein ABF617_05760 [Gluconobacter japonicus]|uniref:hypothetical protein n=1 Tax=Gluconobacter japonicus TaxID=376620 RepID=UPI0039E92A9A
MARPSHDYSRIEPIVRRLHSDGAGTRVIAKRAGISVGSAHAMIGRLGLVRAAQPRTTARRTVRRPMPVGMGLSLGGAGV